jgi:two-component system osmolarity sensor histidine kinase EnvZ
MSYFLMSRQLRPLKRLAIIAETFGRGLDAPDIKTAGAYEIRQTANAFNQMRTRIKRFLKQRTEMLAGVSHDLRTPLTRMKLQISLIKDEKAKSELEADVNEMTSMLDSYVSFVKTESPEPIETIIINELIGDICKTIEKNSVGLVINEKDTIQTSGRQIQLKRAFNNIIDNSQRYAKKIEINLYIDEKNCVIEFNDDGEGIPNNKYEDVFKPFFTLDPSRNKLKGESGLGLTITRDIIRSHGGDVKLFGSNLGGLLLKVLLPL